MRPPFALSALCCLLFAALAHADEAASLPGPFEAGEEATVIEADSVVGRGQEHLQAEGDVVVRQDEREVRADSVDYYSDPERVIARGRVRYQQQGLLLHADVFDYFVAGETGHAEAIKYSIEHLGRRGHGEAERVKFAGPQRYEMENARFSTCEPQRNDWYIGAGHLDLDYGRNRGVVRNATLNFLGAPIAWVPWMDFPLNGQRKSGLLAPRIGSISSGGFDFSLPYYWNIAPNYDMTLTPRYMAHRGTQLSAETRYLQRSFEGELDLQWLDNDAKTGEDRYGIGFTHRQRLAPLLKAGITYQRVSDYAYFADLGDRLAAATQVTLPQEIWFDYTDTHWQSLLRVQRYQTLQDPALPIAPPYWREPQLLILGQQPLRGGTSLQLNAEWVRFRSDPEAADVLQRLQLPPQVEGERTHLYPALSWNLNTPYAFITPRAGVMYTDYRLDREQNAHISRSLPVLSLDTGMTLEREFRIGRREYTQTLEPRLYYVYIPYRNQEDIPDFDTNELTFNFAQMFSENRFSGVDKINNANQITLALTSRFLDSVSGRERMRVALGQRFYFDEQRVHLQQDADTEEAQSSRSDILVNAAGAVSDRLRFDSTLQYKQSDQQVQRGTLTVNYQPRPGHSVNFGYHYERDELRQVDLSAQWPLYRNWYGMGRALYSLRDDELLERVAGVEYNAGCWIMRLVQQQYVVAADRKTTATFLQLELNGLGGIGTNPLGVLRDSIFGYRKSNQLSDEDGQ